MARPLKNNCDYFPHDRDMRDHRKVKAIRSKFGIVGYAIWVMTLEHLTGSDGNVFEYSDLEFELMAGSFGVSATEIRDVIDYCIKLELLFNQNGWINSDSLDKRLAPVYEKRGKAKEFSQKQQRTNGKFATNNTEQPAVSVAEIPQSKVNKTKPNKNKVNDEPILIGNTSDEKFIVVLPRYINETKYRIHGELGLNEFYQMNNSILTHTNFASKFMLDRKGKVFTDFRHLWNDYNQFVNNQFK